jgi:hypothetical protein
VRNPKVEIRSGSEKRNAPPVKQREQEQTKGTEDAVRKCEDAATDEMHRRERRQ